MVIMFTGGTLHRLVLVRRFVLIKTQGRWGAPESWRANPCSGNKFSLRN